MTSCRHCRVEVEMRVEEEGNKVEVSGIRLGQGLAAEGTSQRRELARTTKKKEKEEE